MIPIALHRKNNLQHLYKPETDTLTGIILDDTIALQGRNNLQHLYIPKLIHLLG